MKLLKYVMTIDSGLAPNPFGRWCTLAVCTPNHSNAQLEKNDWIIGHSTKATGNKLIYAMKVTEILSMDNYYGDRRFQYKKPVFGSARWKVYGDNIYYKDKCGRYVYGINPFHKHEFKRDTKYAIVFISNFFYYFGKNLIEEFPKNFPNLIHGTSNFSYEF